MFETIKKKHLLNLFIKILELDTIQEWQRKVILESDPIKASKYMPNKYKRGIGKTTTVQLKALLDMYLNKWSFKESYKVLLLDPDYTLKLREAEICSVSMYYNFFIKFINAAEKYKDKSINPLIKFELSSILKFYKNLNKSGYLDNIFSLANTWKIKTIKDLYSTGSFSSKETNWNIFVFERINREINKT